jgi:tyrosyl-tRNA synthetase
MAVDKVDTNAKALTEQVQRFFHTASLHSRRTKENAAPLVPPKILNNLSWHASLSLISFLRFPGKLLRVNALLTRDSVKSRLASSQGQCR